MPLMILISCSCKKRFLFIPRTIIIVWLLLFFFRFFATCCFFGPFFFFDVTSFDCINIHAYLWYILCHIIFRRINNIPNTAWNESWLELFGDIGKLKDKSGQMINWSNIKPDDKRNQWKMRALKYCFFLAFGFKTFYFCFFEIIQPISYSYE